MLVVTQSKGAGLPLWSRSVRTTATIFASLSLALIISTAQPQLVFAGGTTEADLSKLETKFFLRQYPKDTADARIERLEKMVFGESKTGTTDERMKGLLALVPAETTPEPTPSGSKEAPATTGREGRERTDKAAVPDGSAGKGERPVENDVQDVGADLATDRGESRGRSRKRPESIGREYSPAPESAAATSTENYPAVTLIEKKTLGQGHSGEPIGSRLDRLETKVFGKASGSNDLSWRVDRLKDATNADISKMVPANSDWADDDDAGPSTSYENGDTTPYSQDVGADGRSFSGRDLRGDMQKAFGRPSYPSAGSSGSYGLGSSGGGGYSSSGAYGMGGGSSRRAASSAGIGAGAGSLSDRSAPTPAPDYTGRSGAPRVAMGLSQQLALLENELFRKTFDKETIPARLSRLEQTVYPGESSPGGLSLPDRVRRLSDAVQVSPGKGPQVAAQPKRAAAYDDVGEDQLDNFGQPAPRPAPQRAGSGLSKLINGLGNLMGAGSFNQGYPAGASQLVRDPVSGMLYDPFTGNLYDPVTGVVMGQRAVQGSTMGSGFGYGMSPIGGTPYSPYGMGGMGGMSPGGMRFGFGGSGIRFGSGVGGAPIFP